MEMIFIWNIIVDVNQKRIIKMIEYNLILCIYHCFLWILTKKYDMTTS